MTQKYDTNDDAWYPARYSTTLLDQQYDINDGALYLTTEPIILYHNLFGAANGIRYGFAITYRKV